MSVIRFLINTFRGSLRKSQKFRTSKLIVQKATDFPKLTIKIPQILT